MPKSRSDIEINALHRSRPKIASLVSRGRSALAAPKTSLWRERSAGQALFTSCSCSFPLDYPPNNNDDLLRRPHVGHKLHYTHQRRHHQQHPGCEPSSVRMISSSHLISHIVCSSDQSVLVFPFVKHLTTSSYYRLGRGKHEYGQRFHTPLDVTDVQINSNPEPTTIEL
jgi:hypothetical protein